MDLLEIYKHKEKELRFHVEPTKKQLEVLALDSGIIEFTSRQQGATTAIILKALDESFNKDNAVCVVANNINNLKYISNSIKRILDMNELEYFANKSDYIQIKDKNPIVFRTMNQIRTSSRGEGRFKKGIIIADVYGNSHASDFPYLQVLAKRVVMCLGGVS